MPSHSSNVYQSKDLFIAYDAPGGATLTIYTDLPANNEAGGGLNTQALGGTQITLPATTGRGTYTASLDQVGATNNYLEGTIWKFELVPPNNNIVRLYAGSIRVRKIGVYIQPGQSWRSQELAF